MLVIHGIWAYGALHVWAEDSVLPAQAPPPPGRPSRVPRPHPFAASPGELADALAGAGVAGELAGQAIDGELTLRLPSAGGGPFASPELLRPPHEETSDFSTRRGPALAAWRVPALVFETAAAVPVLALLAELPPGDVVVSGSIGYLAAAARFAGDLAARGRVLPVLAEQDGGYAARWRPVLAAADAHHARELAAAMPPACRALAAPQPPAEGAAGAEPGPLLADMLDAFADTSVRTRLPGALLPARRGRRPARNAEIHCVSEAARSSARHSQSAVDPPACRSSAAVTVR